MASDPDRDETEQSSTGHLDGLSGDCGCAEIWEHLSRQRRAD